MFRSFGVQGKIAGNMREKERALQSAQSAQQYAEVWLSNLNQVLPAEIPCSGTTVATVSSIIICSNLLSTSVSSVTTVPWLIGGTATGYQFQPTNTMTLSGTSPGANTYADYPYFYISDLGNSNDGANGEVYQVDAWGYGGTTGTVAVVESTYVVETRSPCFSCGQ
jgi:type IV pilus assembly protein PilX